MIPLRLLRRSSAFLASSLASNWAVHIRKDTAVIASSLAAVEATLAACMAIFARSFPALVHSCFLDCTHIRLSLAHGCLKFFQLLLLARQGALGFFESLCRTVGKFLGRLLLRRQWFRPALPFKQLLIPIGITLHHRRMLPCLRVVLIGESLDIIK